MGWFDEQIKTRKKHDNDVFAESFINIAGAVMGKKISSALNDDRMITKNAIDEILKYYHLKSGELPDNVKDMNEQLEYLMRPHGIMRRNIELSEGWYKDAIGAMLGTRTDDGSVVALIPNGLSGYCFLDRENGETVKISKKNEHLIDKDALCFYEPFPMKKMGIPQLIKYITAIMVPADYIMIGIATLAATLLGLLVPKLNNIIFSNIIVKGNMRVVLAMATFLIAVIISTTFMEMVRNLLMARIQTKLNISVESATMIRVLSLPAAFFKQYSAGELSSRSEYINALCDMLITTILSTGLTSVFSLAYVTQIFTYTPALVIPAMSIILITVLFTVLSTLFQMKITKKQMFFASKENGMSYSLVTGVQKIKLAGAEKRAFARWGNLYAMEAELLYNPPLFLKLNGVITIAITLIGEFVLYYTAIMSGCTVANYYSFNVAYGMLSGAFTSLAGIALSLAQIKPILDMIKPILETVPEIAEGKHVITRLSGGIELNNISFRYKENMPLVIDNLSLNIRPGQYVAIVGSTGCGKSTLMRLLLGFETPQKGAIYYDGKDLSSVDLKSLRRKIGVVIQEGKLFQGDIYSNIVISAPQLSMDDAWDAAEKAGIAEDIHHMPMGMFTMISEGAGGVSGGQRQRLMIARAIAPKPKILMFDEATSALDNITQKKVSESLDALKCTRIVIAHRLSTIKQCDRIIVLDHGKIVEDGTYEELVKMNGFFSELVARQQVDTISNKRG